MGLIRLLLALSVVLAHTGLFTQQPLLVGGEAAVELFFMISGFLISFVLVQARSYERPLDFWINRALRLYPVYYVVAFAALIYGAASWLFKGSGYFQVYAQLPLAANIGLTLANLLIFFQDWVSFFAVSQGELHLVSTMGTGDVDIWRGLLVPPAWSLGVELSFYLLAPFVLPRRRWIWGLLAVSVLVRIVLMRSGLTQDPWSYRFFPAELGYFLLGSLSHQWLMPRMGAYLDHRGLQYGALLLFTANVVAYPVLPASWRFSVLVAGLFLVLPLLMACQRRHRLDRLLGDLSYPVYIVHWLVLSVLGTAFSHLPALPTAARLGMTLLAVLSAAWLLERLVARRVEGWRDRFRRAHPDTAGRA